MERVIKHWNSLPRGSVGVTIPESANEARGYAT